MIHILLAEDNPKDILLVRQALENGPDILIEFNHPECARAPVIVLTSSDAPRDHARMAELGIARYFKRPLDLQTRYSFTSVG